MTSRRDTHGAGGASLSRLIALACVASMTLSSTAPVAWAQTKAPAKKADAAAADSVMLNFVNADIDAVVRAIGQYTGRTFVIDPRVKGTLTLVTERPVTKQQAFEQLLSGLRLQGFTIVQTGNTMRVVPEADAKLQGGTVVVPRSPSPGGDQLITQVFRLQYESATSMVPILRPLIAPNNTISAYPQNNTLVITDYAENLKRIQRIIEAIDTPATSDLEMIPVKFGLAMEIASIVNRVLDEGARAAGQAIDAGQRVSILAEPRTNTLIVRAPSQARLTLAKNLIAQLDRPASTPGNINVIYLRNAEATRLAPLLRAIISSDPSYVPPSASGGGLSQQSNSAGQPGGSGPGLSAAGGTTTLGSGSASGGGSAGGGGPLAGLIQADSATNSLIITAPEPLYRNIRAIIDKLDVRRAQVVIESLIVEMTADKAAEFGIQWQAVGNLDNGGRGAFASQNFGGAGTNIVGVAGNVTSIGQGLNVGYIAGKITLPGIGEVLNLAFLARALETTGDANILSTPTIQTLDNEEAKFLVGQNIPLITGSFANAGGQAVSGVNPFQTFERKDIGLQLRVKPQITEGGVVRLAIYQELSSIQNTLTAAQGGIITNKRSFESTVLVEDGNIVVLGGLIEDRSENSRSSLPILGRIPGLGALFSYENRGRKKTNLVVFLRPYVVRDEGNSSALALDRYAYIRGQVASNTKPDNLIFRGFEGKQLPETPPVPPVFRNPAPAGSGTVVDPAGLGARDARSAPPAPVDILPPPNTVPLPPPLPERAPEPRSAPPTSAVEPAPRATAVASAPQPRPTAAAPVSMPPASTPAVAPLAAATAPTMTPAATVTPAAAAPPTVAATVTPAASLAAATPTPAPVQVQVETPALAPAPTPTPVIATAAAPSPAPSPATSPPSPNALAAPARTVAASPTPTAAVPLTPPPARVETPAPAPMPAPRATPPAESVARTAPPVAEVIVPPPTSAIPTVSAPLPSTPPKVAAAPATAASSAFTASASSPGGAGSNLIQVAAVSQIPRGRELQQQLRQAGFDAYWESVKTKTGDVVRVRVSVDTATQTVGETLSRLKAMGFDPIVVAP
jgi:general secretion pathway protein D